MHLSDQQNAVVMRGINRRPATWEARELPTMVTDLPDWLLDAHVDLNIAYSNSPDVRFKVSRNPWPINEPKLYEDEGGGAWTARSSDGYLMSRFYHTGPVSRYVAWRIVHGVETKTIVTQTNKDGWMIPVIKYGDTPEIAAEREAENHLALCRKLVTADRDPAHYSAEFTEMFATTRQEGFGGRHFHLNMKDGSTLVLRGPWHGGAPIGWTDLIMFNVSSKWNAEPRIVRGRTIPWYQRGGTGGHFVSEELVLKAVARYQPHMGVALVYPGYGHARYEFYDLNWGAPKKFAQTRLPGWGPAA